MRYCIQLFALLILAGCSRAEKAALPVQQDIFVGGQGGYHTYRIPSMITTEKGTVIVFCEGRKKNGGDTGDIDLMMRRSEDGGKTFGPQSIIWDDADNTCGNPCVVEDRNTKTLWLFSTWNLGSEGEKKINAGKSKDTRRVFILKSTDEGKTWSKPLEVTSDVKKKDWRWFATGPGIGIQLQYGDHKGRLVIPSNYSSPDGSGSQAIYSDDAGKTWKAGQTITPGYNESQAVELRNGSVMMNMRNYLNKGCRGLAISHDGGQTWPEIFPKSNLIEPVCQASVFRLSPCPGIDQSIILFSNPHSAEKRIDMTVQVSLDEGKTWPCAKSLCPGPAAYSCLSRLPDSRIGCFYETGNEKPYEKMVLAIFDINWLTDGKIQ